MHLCHILLFDMNNRACKLVAKVNQAPTNAPFRMDAILDKKTLFFIVFLSHS